MKTTLVALCLSGLLTISSKSEAAEVEVAAVDGLLITAKQGLLQQIKIRSQSLGPGVCRVRASFAGEDKDITAPPHTYSNWVPVGPAINGGTHKLGLETGCDTGALSQIKYEK